MSEPAVSGTIWARRLKRLCDFVLSFCISILVAPILLGAALLVKLSSSGPVFFTQVRTGRNECRFKPFKFRSMAGSRTPDVKEIVSLDHPDVTPVGRLLRRLKIDELPQILNVLVGDMALIGPRPTLPNQTDTYDDFKRQRLLVRPGITGLAQVNGNAAISWEERIKYDVYYVQNHGLWMDIGILLKTMLVVVAGEEKFVRSFDKSPYVKKTTAA